MNFDRNKFLAFYANDQKLLANATQCFDLMQKELLKAGIYSDLTMVGLMATINVETGRTFRPIEEFSSGDQYEGRKDLGNDVPGDGVRFKGRGYIQTSGRFEYEISTHESGIDLMLFPEKLLDPVVSSKDSVGYFKTNRVYVACNAQNWVKVRRIVNGGTNGLERFLSVVNQYLN